MGVIIIDSVKQARELKKDVVEILFLGDMLVAFGEFLRNNQPLCPSGWVEEWWIRLLMRSENFNDDLDLHRLEYDYISSVEAFQLSKDYGIPLHPKYTYCYNDVSMLGGLCQERVRAARRAQGGRAPLLGAP